MNENQLAINNEKYRNLQAKDSPSGRAGYDDITRQYLRFSEIKHFIGDLSGSILDVGCGNAEFMQFLNMTGFEGDYTGLDVSKELLGEAASRFPTRTFLSTDILALEHEQFDYVIASGIFNYDYGQSMELIRSIILKMYALGRRKAIFNGVCYQGTRRDVGTFYIDQWDLCKWLERDVGCKVEVRNCFINYNFTVSLSRTFS